MRNHKYLLRVFIPVVFIVLFAAIPCHAGRWTRELLVEYRHDWFDQISSKSVVCDGNDVIHAVYVKDNRLYHAFETAGGWYSEIIDPNDNVHVSRAEIAIDTMGRFHVGYYGRLYENDVHEKNVIKYALHSGSDWQIQTVEEFPPGRSTYSLGICVDSWGAVHASYMVYLCSGSTYELKYTTNRYEGWTNQVVEEVEYGTWGAIAIDGSDMPRICYEADHRIKFARRVIDEWFIETILDVYGRRIAFSLAIDGAGKNHIGFTDKLRSWESDLSQYYYTDSTGSWTLDEIEHIEDGSAGIGSLLVDSVGTVHICYGMRDNDAEESRLRLRYAQGVAGSFTVEPIDDVESSSSSMVIDSAGVVHMVCGLSSYYGKAPYGIYHVEGNSGTWQTDVLELNTQPGCQSSIAVDSSSHVHVTYYDVDSGKVFYMTNGSGAWEKISVGIKGTIGHERALVVAGNGTVHIAYPNGGIYDSPDLMYAVGDISGFYEEKAFAGCGTAACMALDGSNKAHVLGKYSNTNMFPCTSGYGICYEYVSRFYYMTNVSGVWDTADRLDDDYVLASSIDVDSSGNIHAVYGVDTDTGHRIYYMINVSGTWSVKQTITPSGTGYARIAVDSADKVHIVYLDSNYNGSVLHHYTNAAGYWDDEVVDNMSGLSKHLSLAVDPANHLHICYNSGDTLKYATDVSGSWHMENVADSLDYPYPSIAVDAAGVHISYYDNQTECLMYATDTLPSKAIEVEPLSLSFIVNEDGHSTLPVVVRNVGNLVLNVGAASITGDDAGEFSKTDMLPTNLGVGSTTQIDVTFDPAGLGSFDAQLTIPSDDPDAPETAVDLHGVCFTVPGPYLEIVPPKNWEGFGEVIVGQTSVTAPFTIKNNSSIYTFTITNGVMVFDPDNFHVVPSPYPGACPSIKTICISPGEQCSVGVTFTPTTVGSFDSILYVYASDPFSEEASAFLEGTGIPVPVPELLVGPSEHAFGPQQITAASEVLMVDVANVGDAELKIYAITHLNDPNFILDLDGGKYPIGSSFPVCLAPGEMRNFTVSFCPQQVGNLEDTVTVTAYADGQVLLSGEGTHWNQCDFDIDGDVDLDDFSFLADHWMGKVEGWPPDVAPDPLDGRINMFDLYVFAENWLESL